MYYNFYALLLFLFSFTAWAQAQTTLSVNGRVQDDAGNALIGVSVAVKGTSSGTTTDADGNFLLETAGDATLVFSYVGFLAQEVAVNNRTELDITLRSDEAQLQEIVVVGYSSQTRKSLTGSVSSVRAADIQDIPVASANQLLQGKAAGVLVSANSGVPGGGVFIRVRGTNSVNADNEPLYVVDGVFINNRNLIATGMGNQQQSNPIADLNPADIESIQILKDANATAIYGSHGANGVVIITTKRGKASTKSRVTLSSFQGWAEAPKVFQVVTGPQLAELENERHLNDKGSIEQLPYRPRAQGGLGTPEEQPTFDRISDLFRTARTSNYEASVSGGSENTQFFISGGYLNQQSIVRPSAFERYSFRFNLDHFISQKVKIGTSTALIRTGRNVSSNDNNPVGVINSALFPRSNQPILNDNGTYAKYGNFDNHLALIRELNNDARANRVISNVFDDTWGGVPLVLKPTRSIADGEGIGRSTLAQTYDQVLADLTEAEKLLPEAATRNRAVKNAARALRARLHLYRQQWAEAETYSTQIIANTNYRLVTPYKAFFTAPFLTQESIFEITYSNADQNSHWNNWYPSALGGQYTLQPSPNFIENVNKADIGGGRKDLIASVVNGGTTFIYGNLYNRAAQRDDSYYLLRIAEQYLIRAEARARQNKIAEALGDLNAVRTRAGLSVLSLTTAEAILLAIENERRYEFAFEADRWFDLARTGRIDDVLGITDERKWLLPIPLREIDADPELEQNPGY